MMIVVSFIKLSGVEIYISVKNDLSTPLELTLKIFKKMALFSVFLAC